MAQIDPKDLDYSGDMTAYFERVATILVDDHHLSTQEARRLISSYFALDVSPLERALAMHSDPTDIASGLATRQESVP